MPYWGTRARYGTRCPSPRREVPEAWDWECPPDSGTRQWAHRRLGRLAGTSGSHSPVLHSTLAVPNAIVQRLALRDNAAVTHNGCSKSQLGCRSISEGFLEGKSFSARSPKLFPTQAPD